MREKQNTTFSRRDFLKTAAAALAATSGMGFLPHIPWLHPVSLSPPSTPPLRPNVIILLFDTLAAKNMSLYGYPRATTSNLERFAQRGTVYNRHYAAANFTTPSTATFLTGSYPWTHRAFNLGALIRPETAPFNLFNLLAPVYYQAVYTQNTMADTLLYQTGGAVEEHHRLDSFALAGKVLYPSLARDEAVYGLQAYDHFHLVRKKESGSLFLAPLRDLVFQIQHRGIARKYLDVYPTVNPAELGELDAALNLPRLTNTDVYFSLEQVVDGVMGLLDQTAAAARRANKPFLTYIHFMPPHTPYMPRRPFLGSFNDGWAPPPKPNHRLGSRLPLKKLDGKRQRYDEFIANVDHEMGRIFDYLERSGRLKDSIVMVTSDHGEMFERGEEGHSTPMLYDALVRVPLVISSPGQERRVDIHSVTSTVDILPTLLGLAGISGSPPAPLEGQPLPGLEKYLPIKPESHSAERGVFIVEAKEMTARQRLSDGTASTAIVAGRYKLIHYQRYKRARDKYEFYDLLNDPEENDNRYANDPLAKEYQAELTKTVKQGEARVFGA